MKLKYLFFATFAATLIMASCGKKKEQQAMIPMSLDASKMIVGDSMKYGLACEGTNDSNVIVMPFDGSDPITYSCIDATKNHRIIGNPQVGDWVGLMLDKEDTTVATMVVNLDKLKGTWTYTVMPTFKEFTKLSKRAQKRMEKSMIKEMPDSEKALYLVPREYGFVLKRSHNAQSVGRVMGGTSNDDSPVEYPEVKNYSQWFSWNGKIILVSSKRQALNNNAKKPQAPKPVFDTLEYISLTDDSLVLKHNDKVIGFHRKSSAITANAVATKKAQEATQKATANLK